MSARRATFAVRLASVVIVLAASGCTGGSSDTVASTTTTTTTTVAGAVADTTSTTTVPSYGGDPDSDFCQELSSAADRPLLDPFASGIDARELDLRLRALLVRFERLVSVAPPEVADDVALVAAGLVTLDEALARHGHDLAAAAEAGEDLSFLDAPEFGDVALRIAAYQQQVCRS